MAGKSRRGDGVTVSFGAKFAQSDQFRTVFREGMALVEAAATYLDGDGRKEARKLQQKLAIARNRNPTLNVGNELVALILGHGGKRCGNELEKFG